jgi:hypothetical protein
MSVKCRHDLGSCDKWLRESMDPAAVGWRYWVEREREARDGRSKARARARTAFKRGGPHHDSSINEGSEK